MKKISFLVLFVLSVGLFFWVMKPSGQKRDPASTDSNSSIEEHSGSLQYVACFARDTLSIRDDALTAAVFKIKPFEAVKPIQGWEETKKLKEVRGQTFVFVKAQFPEQEDENNDIGWIEEKFIRARAECIGAQDSGANEPDIQTPISGFDEVASSATGLDDPNCCKFPLLKPTNSFMSGMARFGHPRDHGKRIHAACDLYQTKNAPIASVGSGTIISSLYKFYQGTWALEVKHSGGFVIRYGEMTGKAVPGVSKKKKVSPGQQVGFMGRVNSNCCEPMLHFELYSGAAKGSLNAGGKYKRRSDLMNPTKYLLSWRKKQFGN